MENEAPFATSPGLIINLKFNGMNGRIAIDPLPANITVAYPSGVDSTGLELPTFDEGNGVQALSFFLGDFSNKVNARAIIGAMVIDDGGPFLSLLGARFPEGQLRL